MIHVQVYYQHNLDEQDVVRSVASEIRHLAFLALYLSMPYMINVAALMLRR